jgi:hypothetical protein
LITSDIMATLKNQATFCTEWMHNGVARIKERVRNSAVLSDGSPFQYGRRITKYVLPLYLGIPDQRLLILIVPHPLRIHDTQEDS